MTTPTSHQGRYPRRTPSAASTPEPTESSEPRPGPVAERLAYSVDEAARLTGLSRDLLYDQMRQGNLPYLKIGRRRLITRQHLEQFLTITPDSARLDGTMASTRRAVADAP